MVRTIPLLVLLAACSEGASLPIPTLQALQPAEGVKGARTKVVLEGAGLHLAIESQLSQPTPMGGLTLQLGDTLLEEVVLIDDGTIEATVPVSLDIGRHQLTLSFSDGRSAQLDDAFLLTCVSAAQCEGQEVCDPSQRICIADLPCSTHGECGVAGYCGEDERCAPNDTGGLCDTTPGCIAGELCTEGYCGCGGDLFAARIRPNMLIVLDRSGSMDQTLPSGTSKWDAAKSAIETLLLTYQQDIDFGLMVYPGQDPGCDVGMSCERGVVAIEVAPNARGAITTYLGIADTCSLGTPTSAALESVAGYAPLQDPNHSGYVLLITDGKSDCADPVPAVTALRNLPRDVQTFAVGFGSSVDADELGGIAMAGGTAQATQAGGPSYFQADDAMQLTSVLNAIAGATASCTFSLSGFPPRADLLRVFAAGAPIERDTSRNAGWDYDLALNQIFLYGPACDNFVAAATQDLAVSYGCADD